MSVGSKQTSSPSNKWGFSPGRYLGTSVSVPLTVRRSTGPEQPFLVMITGLPGSGKSTVAEEAAGLLDATLLAHDWAMSGLRPYPDLQNALDGMQPVGHGPVGWSILRTGPLRTSAGPVRGARWSSKRW